VEYGTNPARSPGVAPSLLSVCGLSGSCIFDKDICEQRLECAMISIKTFQISKYFERRTYEFFDEKLIVKIKSLMAETEYEVKYEKIKVIETLKQVDSGWVWAGFALLSLPVIIFLLFNLQVESHPILQMIQKVLLVLGLILYIPAFRRNEFCFFLDADRNYLVTIRVNNKNRKSLQEALRIIKQKAEIIGDMNLINPVAELAPVFEMTQYDLPDFGNKSNVRFYEDRIIDYEKSFAEETLGEVKYSELSGKTRVVKSGNSNWDYASSYWLVFFCSAFLFIFAFFPQMIRFDLPYPYLAIGGLVLIIPLYLMRFVKEDVLLFYNNNDVCIFWMKRNSANSKKLDEIVEFLQSKISTLNHQGNG
jgi:hypothetical protein